MDILSGINTRVTPQNQSARPDQVKNSAGGFVFQISDAERLKRFLILGADANTYYINAADLTRANAEVAIRMALDEPEALLSTILDVSLRGAAPKQNATLFALAAACSFGDIEFRQKALSALPQIARTGTHLFLFARYIEQFRGWGRSLRRAVGDWYMSKPADKLAYQAVKYRQREGWSHRDLLRLSHPRSVDPAMNATFDWITHNSINEDTPRLITGFKLAQGAVGGTDGKYHAELVRDYGLTWEMLPDEALAHTVVWDALLDRGMGMTALIRQLSRLTRLGMLPAIGGRTDEVVAMLTNSERLLKDRIHPINVLVAHMTYLKGEGNEGSSTWTPNTKVVDALDSAFYLSYGSVEPTGKRVFQALDVSGSMGGPVPTGKTDRHGRPKVYPFTSRDISAAMAMVTMATEPSSMITGFTGGGGGYGWSGMFNNIRELSDPDFLTPLNISPRQRLNDVIRDVSGLPFGRTDCALPMVYALKHKIPIDTFVIYTDNETWSGGIHPHQAMRQYRETMGIPAKLVVAAVSSTGFSIADPNDPGMLDVVGFDTAVPSLISQFSKGL